MGVGQEGHLIAPDEETFREALQNLLYALDAARAAVAGVVELTMHSGGLNNVPRFAALNGLNPQDFPSWTAVGVLEMALPEMLIEVKTTK